jgi:hypothetical protein
MLEMHQVPGGRAHDGLRAAAAPLRATGPDRRPPAARPHRRASSPRRAVLCFTLLAAAALLAACGTTARERLDPPDVPAVAVVIARDGTSVALRDVAPLVRAGVAQLLAAPSVEVTYRATGTDSGDVAGTASVSPARRSYALVEQTTGDSFAFAHERRLVDGVLHLRDVQAGVDSASVPWAAIPYVAEAAADAAKSLTARGRAVQDLDRLVVLVENVPFTARQLDGTDRRYLLAASVEAVEAFYRASGLEQVEAPAAHDASAALTASADTGAMDAADDEVRFAVGFDTDGTLVWLQAAGSVFSDGEVLRGALVEIRYAPAAAEIAIAVPTDG